MAQVDKQRDRMDEIYLKISDMLEEHNHHPNALHHVELAEDQLEHLNQIGQMGRMIASGS